MNSPFFNFDSDALAITVRFDKLPDLLIDRKAVEVSYFSSGPGGQHANRHMNGVRLVYRIPDEHRRASAKTQELMARSIRHRHQEANMREAFEVLFRKIRQYFYVPPLRKKTKASRSAKERRLKAKKMQGLKKQGRRIDQRSL